MMDKLIAGFSNQLRDALKIGKSYHFRLPAETLTNVVIAGLGGSGIGGTIIQNYTWHSIKVPLIVSKNYFLPAFVGNNSLVIISSYSGNTEETISCLKAAIKAKAKIVCITSGGEVAAIAEKHQLDCIIIPGGMPPRTCLGYSLVQLLFGLSHFKLVNKSFEKDINAAIALLDQDEKNIRQTAKKVAGKLAGRLPIIYTSNDMEGIAVRWRQQLNENGKILGWHHVIPEMNHNELVGWQKKQDAYTVLFLRNEDDYSRINTRIEINKKIIKQYSKTIIDIYSKGDSYLEKALYLIHLGDWVSWSVAQANEMDAMEVKVIDYLKGELAKQK